MSYECLTKKELIELLSQKDNLVNASVNALNNTRKAVDDLKDMFDQKDRIVEQMIVNDRKNAEEMERIRHELNSCRIKFLVRGFFFGALLTFVLMNLVRIAFN